jgi:hypothetical protein
MKFTAWMVGAVLALGVFTVAADPVVPATLSIECKRNVESSVNITNIVYYQGDHISFSNSVMYVDAAGTVVQDLDGCTITVVMGTTGNTNVTMGTGYSIDDATGVWGAEVIVPPFNPAFIEVTVSNNYIFTYPRYRIATKAKLGE